MKVYILQTAEPDAYIVEVWCALQDAERRRAEMHARWPGMGYHVEAHDVRNRRDTEPDPQSGGTT